MRTTLLFMLCVLLWGGATAQFKLVPQSKLDSVANPRTAASTLVVEKNVVDLGRVAESAVTEHRVVVRNRGKEPILLTTRATCRCLSANGGVVKGGESLELLLKFSGKGFPGPFDHKLFVYQVDKTQTPIAVVRVKGYVVSDADPKNSYPYPCGGLLLRTPSVKFSNSCTERIACINASQRDVRVVKDALLSSKEVSIKSEPEILKPGEEGDLVISLTAEKSEQIKLYIEADVAPRNREIKIE